MMNDKLDDVYKAE